MANRLCRHHQTRSEISLEPCRTSGETFGTTHGICFCNRYALGNIENSRLLCDNWISWSQEVYDEVLYQNSLLLMTCQNLYEQRLCFYYSAKSIFKAYSKRYLKLCGRFSVVAVLRLIAWHKSRHDVKASCQVRKLKPKLIELDNWVWIRNTSNSNFRNTCTSRDLVRSLKIISLNRL